MPLVNNNNNPRGAIPSNAATTPLADIKQSLYIVRHGDRWDYAHPEVREGVCGLDASDNESATGVALYCRPHTQPV